MGYKSHTDTMSKRSEQEAVVLGGIQAFLGGSCIAFNAIAIQFAEGKYYSLVSYGIWGGFMYALAGAVQIAAGKTAKKGLAAATVGLSVLALCAAIVTIILGILTADSHGQYMEKCLTTGCESTGLRNSRIVVSMNSLMVIFSFFELAVAIWSIVSSSVFCCCPEKQHHGIEEGGSYTVQNVAYTVQSESERKTADVVVQ